MISTRDLLILWHSVYFGPTTIAQVIIISNLGIPSVSNFCGRSNSDVMLGFLLVQDYLGNKSLN